MAKNPSKVQAGEDGQAHKLAATAPAELVDISKQFSRDPEVARAMQDALFKARERATIKIDPSRAHELASSNEPAQTRTLTPGIDPIFDRWIKANNSGDREERARLSALLRQDDKLRKIAQSVEPGYAASFKADWERCVLISTES